MSFTGLAAFDDTIHATNIWLKDIKENLNWSERGLALKALRVVLHALRDRLPTQDSAHFSAQLPMLIRGIYFEGWIGEPPNLKQRSAAQFMAPIEQAFANYPSVEAEDILKAVFDVISQHVSQGEVEKILHALPQDIRQLFVEDERSQHIRGL